MKWGLVHGWLYQTNLSKYQLVILGMVRSDQILKRVLLVIITKRSKFKMQTLVDFYYFQLSTTLQDSDEST